jgi:hypothetical protein
VRPLVIFVCALAVAVIGWTAWTAKETANLVSMYVQDSAFVEAVTACEEAEQLVGAPFQYRKAKSKKRLGLFSRDTATGVIPSLMLCADGVYCIYSPLLKRAEVWIPGGTCE